MFFKILMPRLAINKDYILFTVVKFFIIVSLCLFLLPIDGDVKMTANILMFIDNSCSCSLYIGTN